MFINPWWVHHCAGNLDEKNDPYSENYDYPFSWVRWYHLLLTAIELVFWTVPFTKSIMFIVKHSNYFPDWRMWLSIPIVVVITLAYAMLNAITIKAILKIGDKKKKK